jgi:hypothetical protein
MLLLLFWGGAERSVAVDLLAEEGLPPGLVACLLTVTGGPDQSMVQGGMGHERTL